MRNQKIIINLDSSHCKHKRISVSFLFAITSAGVVPCGGPKKSPYTIHSADYISFWSFETSEGILRN